MAIYNENNPVTGRSVLWWVISFFVVIFIANFFFVYFALTSWTGLATDNAYEKGLKYNQTLAQAETQKKLGWLSSVDLADGKILKVKLIDKQGAALTGYEVTAGLIRPVKEGSDHEVKLREVAPGQYQSPVELAFKGRWQVEVRVGGQYKMRHDLEIK